MNLPLRILRAAGITLAVVVGLPVLLLVWINHSYIRQEIRVDTGEIREVHEGVLWNSSPENSHETLVTPVLKKHGIGMKVERDPWVFFNRVHAFVRMGGDFSLESDLLAQTDRWGENHSHYGDFLDAVAQYRSPQEAALWWKALMTPAEDDHQTKFIRWAGFRSLLRFSPQSVASQAEFDAWYADLMDELSHDESRAGLIPLFKEIQAGYAAQRPSPKKEAP